MAGNKVNAKAKGKDDRSKGSNKPVVPNNEETDDPDFSLLRKPIPTSITSFGQARKIFDMATEELQNLLSEECDLLYECKVCRNLFRSLANFISHKRVYCKEKFNNTIHGHFIKATSTLSQLSQIKNIEEGYQESLKEINVNQMDLDEVDQRVPLTKDLTAVYEKISYNRGIPSTDKDPQLLLQKIPNSSVAVFQNYEMGTENASDTMKNQVTELDSILSREVAVLQRGGGFAAAPDKVIHISDDDDKDQLKCNKCDMVFSTGKTLRFHLRHKHLASRLVFPCPDCLEVFSTTWSVFRHLFKVHRKTAAQIKRLRESIQAKAFKMNNPPASYEKRRNNMKTLSVHKISEEERLDQENQAWMENIESDSSVSRCGGCGRAFERRAALAAHTHTCRARRRIHIQIRRDYHKPDPPPVTEKKPIKETKEETPEPQEAKEPEVVEVAPDIIINNDDDNSVESITPSSVDDQMSNGVEESPEKMDVNPEEKPPEVIRLPFAQHAEKSNLMALRQRVIGDIHLDKLACKKCATKCTNIQELYDHVAKHYRWMRYACKLCNFKHYQFEKLPEHVKIVHKLKGDKDFYFSTVKAIDGQEALDLAEPVEENTEGDDTSPKSRRPSRCSSDSSRVSDDGSISGGKLEGAKKRKMQLVPCKAVNKRRKSIMKPNNEDQMEWLDKEYSPPKVSEETSSDTEDTCRKLPKKQDPIKTTVASRRPVRRKTKPKNADFEYDLSNLLKMEAQGYRESQTPTTAKSTQIKKKPQPDPMSNYTMLNKECCGSLVSLSRSSVENAKAHMKTLIFAANAPKERVFTNIFPRPMLPNKTLAKGDKISPKKDVQDKKDSSEPNKETDKEKCLKNAEKSDNKEMCSKDPEKRDDKEKCSKNSEKSDNKEKYSKDTDKSDNKEKCIKDPEKGDDKEKCSKYPEKVDNKEKCSKDPEKGNNKEKGPNKIITKEKSKSPEKNDKEIPTLTIPQSEPSTSKSQSNATSNAIVESNNEQNNSIKAVANTTKVKNINIPSVVPLKFRRQSLEVMTNPLINKNINEFAKAGMKTKILVIKPFNITKDGTQPLKAPLKFQTIKIKDSGSKQSSDDKHSDQVVVVKVPKVDCIANSERLKALNAAKNITDDAEVDEKLTENLNNNTSTAIETEAETQKPPTGPDKTPEVAMPDQLQVIYKNNSIKITRAASGSAQKLISLPPEIGNSNSCDEINSSLATTCDK